MSKSMKNVECITLFVDDLRLSKAFCQNVFHLPLVYEDDNSAVFNFENLSINLLVSSAAHELIEPATVAGHESGARFQLTIPVDDVDATCAELAELGVTLLNGPLDRPGGIRTASFTDPGGHIWQIAQ